MCTCYKCVAIQLQSEQDTIMYEGIKDEKERTELFSDGRGLTVEEYLGFAARTSACKCWQT